MVLGSGLWGSGAKILFDAAAEEELFHVMEVPDEDEEDWGWLRKVGSAAAAAAERELDEVLLSRMLRLARAC